MKPYLNRNYLQWIVGIVFLSIVGCGENNGSPKENDSEGSIALTLEWPDTSSAVMKTFNAPKLVLNGDGTVNCEQSDIAKIKVTVYDEKGEFLKNNEEGWDCSTGSGTISGVKTGVNRRVLVICLNSLGKILYWGENGHITVTSNGSYDATQSNGPQGSIKITLNPGTPPDEDDDSDGYTDNQGDCDDNDGSIYPGQTEICNDDIDQDCNGQDLVCPDEDAPYVAATDPINNAIGVDVSQVIHIQFSEAMDSDTITAGTITLRDSAGMIPCAVTTQDNEAVLTPASPLEYGMAYDVIVTTAVTDLAGNPMASAYEITFQTKDRVALIKAFNGDKNEGSFPYGFFEFNGDLYFCACNASSWNTELYQGYELWKSDGTEAGTDLVKDIYPGASSGSPSNFTDLNGKLYFTADHPDYGNELWVTNGVTTSIVRDINQGTGGSDPSYLTELNNTLYFRAYDGTYGSELWYSTGSNTYRVDINPGSGGSNPSYLTKFNGSLYFQAYTGANGYILYKGSYSSFSPLQDQNGNYVFNPYGFTESNGKLYFQAYDAINGTELWVTDGTAAGTSILMNIYADGGTYPNGSYPSSFVDVDGTLFFTANDGMHGRELWKTDVDGTAMVLDIYSGTGSSSPSNLVKVGSRLYFQAYDSTHGYELWSSIKTTSGYSTSRVKDIYAGLGSSSPSNLTDVDGVLYFSAIDGDGSKLWKSEGSSSSTVSVADINPYGDDSISGLTAFDGGVVFRADDGVNGYELWFSDGTDSGTRMIRNINVSKYLDYDSQDMAVAGEQIFFRADNGVNGTELWVSDGTPDGTGMVKDINTGINSSYIDYLTPLSDSQVLFSAYDGLLGTKLWASDGTEAGTLCLNICTGACSSYPSNLFAYNGLIYMTATDDNTSYDYELWSSDGTVSGNSQIMDINASGSSYPYSFQELDNTLYFLADEGTGNGYGLWRSDGTSSNTQLVTDFGTDDIRYMEAVSGSIYMLVNDYINSVVNLWTSDGTEIGTVILGTIPPFDNATNLTYSDVYLMDSATIGSKVLFACYYYYYYYEQNSTYYYTAGTTYFITDSEDGSIEPIISFQDYYSDVELTALNGMFFFAFHDAANGTELWSSDGTAAGTGLFKDINPTGSSDPQYFIVHKGKLYFSADDGEHGYELWVSDGTPEGTHLCWDVNPFGHSYPKRPVIMNDTLYFKAYDAEKGVALRKLND